MDPTTASYKFKGWLALDKDAVDGKMGWSEYHAKTWEEGDVDIKVTHCGVCASDLHVLRSGWGPAMYPCGAGHEIVGVIVRASTKVENGLKLGDRVGIGPQAMSCLKCDQCLHGRENYCAGTIIGTYNGLYPDGSKSYGGYGQYCRVSSKFVVKIPEQLKSEEAAPMLCAGVTMYSALKRNGAGAGKRVGIVGIGGVGHLGLLFARALGCDKVVAISRNNTKREDLKLLGADDLIDTSSEDWSKKNERTLDLIISTVTSSKMPLEGYLRLLRFEGQLIQVGLPEDHLPPISIFSLASKSCKISGSSVGSMEEMKAMLNLAVEKGIHPWVQTRPMEEANQVIVDMENGLARYRYVLVNSFKTGGMT